MDEESRQGQAKIIKNMFFYQHIFKGVLQTIWELNG